MIWVMLVKNAAKHEYDCITYIWTGVHHRGRPADPSCISTETWYIDMVSIDNTRSCKGKGDTLWFCFICWIYCRLYHPDPLPFVDITVFYAVDHGDDLHVCAGPLSVLIAAFLFQSQEVTLNASR